MNHKGKIRIGGHLFMSRRQQWAINHLKSLSIKAKLGNQGDKKREYFRQER